MTLREKYPLHPKKVIKKTIAYCSTLAIPIFFLLILGLLISPVFFLSLLLPLVIYLWQKKYYEVYFYDLTDRGLEIKKGVFFPNSITIPIEKVSDVYIDQDLFDRYFGLYDLHFSAASQTSGVLAHIDGLDKGTTDALHAYLMSAFKSGRGEAPAESYEGAKAAPVSLATFKPAPEGYWAELLGSALGIGVLFLFLGPLFVICFPVLLVLLLVMAVYIKKEYQSRIYEIRKDGLWVRKGWLMPSETMIFYQNIQDVDVVQSIFERLWNLQSVSVKSMSALSAISAKMVMLSKADAKRMQEEIHRQIELSRGKAAKSRAAAAGVQPVQATPVVAYKGALLTAPYETQFMKGYLTGSSPPVIFFSVLALLALVLGAIFGSGTAAVAGGVLLLIALFIVGTSIVAAVIQRAIYSYSIGPEGLTIETGLLMRFKKVIRYEKIQDIKLHCGFVHSFFGIVSVHVETGSKDLMSSGRSRGMASASAVVTERIPYLSSSDAQALRAKLLKIANITYPESGTPLRESVPLAPAKPFKKALAWVGVSGFQVFLLSLLFLLMAPPALSLIAWVLAMLMALYVLSAFPIYKYEQLYMKKYFYDENADTLVIRKGVFGWSEIVVPFRNIQSVYIDQDLFDVYFDLWDVWITTVTATSGPMAHIDGVSRADAEKLARLLIERVEKSRK